MEGKKKSIPIWVWILVVIGFMAGSTFFQQRRVIPYATYTILLKDAKDVSRGAPVRYRGVYAGRVLDTKLSKGGKSAEVVIRLNEDVELHKDAKFTLKRNGLLGNKYLELTDAGSSAEQAEPGQTFEVDETASASADTNLSQVTKNVANVAEAARSHRELQEISNRLVRVERKLDRLTAQVGKLSQKR
ncbi:MAG: MlaD family protein [Acidobacteriota bacterium]